MYELVPTGSNIIVVPLKPKEVKIYTSKVLSDVETSNMDVIQYGRVISGTKFKPGDIVLYQKLASHKTNFGDPRQVIISTEFVEAYLKENK